MADAYLGEIRIFAGNFAPKGWAFCDGQLMSIAQNTALFSILGVQYGGDGKTTFALPNLMGNAVMNQGHGQGLTSRSMGSKVGSSTVTLIEPEMPAHTHVPQGIDTKGNSIAPNNNYWAQAFYNRGEQQTKLYDPTPNTTMSPVALSTAGNTQPHNNMQPYIAQNFIICVSGGEYPSRG